MEVLSLFSERLTRAQHSAFIWSSYSFRKQNPPREVAPYLPCSNWVSVKDRVTALRQHLPLHAVSIFGALESFSRAWMKQSARQCRKQSTETISPDINLEFLNPSGTEALECTQITENMKAY